MVETLAFEAALSAQNFLNGINQMKSSVGQLDLSKGLGSSNTALDGMAAKFQGLQATAGGGIQGITSSLMGIGPAGLVAAGGIAAIGAALATSVGKASEFDSIIHRISATTGQGQAGLQDLAQQMARTTSKGMMESAQVMAGLAGQGVQTLPEMTSVLPATLKLMSASGIEMGAAVSLTTTSLKQFGLGAADADREVNLLVAGAQKGKTNVEDLGAGLQLVGPIASQLGLSLEDATTAMSMMAAAGIKGSQAGQALKMGLDVLGDPSKAVADVLASIGVSAEEVNPSVHSLDEILTTLNEHGITTAQGLQMFGARAGPGMNALLQQGIGGFDKYKASITGTDAATKAASEAGATYAGAMKKMGNAMEEAQITAGTALLPALTSLVTGFTGAMRAAIDFGKAVSEAFSWATSGEGGQAVSKWLSDITGGMLGSTGKAAVGAEQLQRTWEEATALEAGMTWDEMYGKGIEANKDAVTDATKKAVGGPDAKNAVVEAAEDLAKEFAKVYGSELGSVMADFNLGAAEALTYQNKIAALSAPESQSGTYQIGATTVNGIALKSVYYYGKNQTEFEIRNETGGVLAHGTAASLGIGDPASPAGQRDAIRKLIEQSPWMTEQIGSLELQGLGGEANKIKIKGNVVLENLWDVEDSTRSIAKFMDANKDLVKVGGEEMAYTLMNALNNNIVKASPTLQESLSNVMKAIASPGSVPASILNQSLGDLIDADVIEPRWRSEIERAASVIPEAFEKPIANAGAWVKSQLADMAQQASNAWKDGLTQKEADAILAFEPILTYMKTTFPQFFEEAGGEGMLRLIEAIKANGGDVEAAMAAIGGSAGNAYKSALFGTLKSGIETRSLADLIADPTALSGAVSDWKQWAVGTFRPALKSEMDNMNKLYQTGYEENYKVVKENLDLIAKASEEHSTWFEGWMNRLFSMYSSGMLSMADTLEIFDAVMNDTEQKTKSTSKGYDNLKKTIQDCSDCAISEFGEWQEAQEGLFSGSYLAQGGAAYEEWKTGQIQAIAETQEAMKRMGGVVVGKDYTQQWAEMQKVKIDTSEADGKITNTQNGITKLLADARAGSELKLDTTAADAGLTALVASIDANRYQTIYVETLHYDTYAGAGGAGGYPTTWENELAASAQNQLQGLFGSYQEGTDYVPATGPYLLHRGEGVTPAGQNSGGIHVEINAPMTVQGDINGVEGYEELLDKRDAALRKEFTTALNKMAKA